MEPALVLDVRCDAVGVNSKMPGYCRRFSYIYVSLGHVKPSEHGN